MTDLRCLYVEDRLEDREILIPVLKKAWRRGALEIVERHSLASGMKEITEHGDTYQLLILDILLPETDQSRAKANARRGLMLAEHAAESYPKLAIIALSMAERDHPGTERDFRKRGHGYLDKDLIKEGRLPSSEIENVILEALAATNPDLIRPSPAGHAAKLDWLPKDNLVLAAQVYSVGPEHLAALAHAFAPHCTSFVVRYTSPGLSGAIVFRVEGSGDSGAAVDLLLKVSRDEAALRRELANAPAVGAAVPGLYVKYVQGIYAAAGWSAIAAEYVSGAVALLDWLTIPGPGSSLPTPAQVTHVLAALFGSLHREHSQETATPEQSALHLAELSLAESARVALAMEELWPLVERHASGSGGASPDRSQIDLFLRDHTIGSRSARTLPESAETMCHGDLHCRNMLVTTDPRPVLIDPSDRGPRHWAFDHARLVVDLFVLAFDRGLPSYEWENLARWRSLVQDWIAGRPAGTALAGANALVWEALCHVRTSGHASLRKQHENLTPKWEMHLALAAEFLRAAGRADLSPAKRCLALACGADLLRSVAGELPPRASVSPAVPQGEGEPV